MVHPASASVLTPGTPAYAALKLGAVGGLFGLRFLLSKRSQGAARADEAEAVRAPVPAARPHSVSKRKQQRRKRR